MPVIQKPNDGPLNANGHLMIPSRFVPSFRVVHADERKCRMNLLFRMHGGLGDIVCAEPAVRYALNHFKDIKFSLATLYPGLFQHLKFEKVFHQGNVNELKIDDYLLYENTDTGNELAAEFLCHTLMHGIDYASLYMWRLLLPLNEREIKLVPTLEEDNYAAQIIEETEGKTVIVHPGKTWQSRTFPKKWWDEVINTIHSEGGHPVIIGGTVDQGRATTVDVDTTNALDLRYKQTFMQTVALLQHAKVLITNDSSPLHMATTGDSWIGFLSTVKHPDHLYTWRTPSWDKGSSEYKGQWKWRMEDLALGGVYKELDPCPNKNVTVRVDGVDVLDLLKWLPPAKSVARWAMWKLYE